MAKRKSLLSDAQRTRFFALPTGGGEILRHYSLHEADLKLINRRRRPHNRLGFAVQLCLMRYPGRALGTGEVPPAVIVAFIAEQLGLTIDLMRDYAQRDETRREHLAELQAARGYRTVTKADYRSLALAILPLAMQTDKVDALVPELLETFRQQRILIPAPAVIERIVMISQRRALVMVQRELTRDLTAKQREQLEQLLLALPGTRISYLAWLRLPPNAPVTGNLIKLIERLEFLRGIGINPQWAQRLHRNRLLLLSREGERLSQQHFMRLEPERRHAMLVSVVLELMVTLTDDSLDMFGKVIGSMFAKAKLRKAEQFHADGKALIERLSLLTRAVRAALDARQNATDPFAAMDKVIPLDELLSKVEEAEKVAKTEDLECISLLVAYHHSVRGFAPRLLNAFEFRAAPSSADIVLGLDCVRKMYAACRRQINGNAPVSFVKNAWKRYVFTESGGIDRRYYEMCLFAQLRDRLRAGEIFVAGSRQYKDFEQYLLPQSNYAEMKSAGTLPVSVPVDFATYICRFRSERIPKFRREGATLFTSVFVGSNALHPCTEG